MLSKRSSSVSGWLSGLLAALMHHTASAQQAEPVEPQKLQEVVVTAQKRTENLQSVPIAVQVIGAQVLAEQNHKHVRGPHGNGAGRAYFQLRQLLQQSVHSGVGSGGSNPSFDQSVAMFTDDIFHGRSRMSGATFLDLDRIEVLKGPQSGFFGNNSIAGALNIVTRKPTDTVAASARALYGMFGQYALEGAVGGPLSDLFSARLAITRNGDSSGWIDNVSTGEHVPRVNNEAGRLSLLFHPNEDLDALLKVEGGSNKVAGSPGDQPPQIAHCPPPAPSRPSCRLRSLRHRAGAWASPSDWTTTASPDYRVPGPRYLPLKMCSPSTIASGITRSRR